MFETFNFQFVLSHIGYSLSLDHETLIIHIQHLDLREDPVSFKEVSLTILWLYDHTLSQKSSDQNRKQVQTVIQNIFYAKLIGRISLLLEAVVESCFFDFSSFQRPSSLLSLYVSHIPSTSISMTTTLSCLFCFCFIQTPVLTLDLSRKQRRISLYKGP